MSDTGLYLQFWTAESFSWIAIIISLFSLIWSLILSRREGPNIMPEWQKSVLNHFELYFLNTSNFNLKNLSILINGFDSKELTEINDLHITDKYLFTIWEKSKFSYGFNLWSWAKNGFYFRVRFRGKYTSRIGIDSYVEQELWYKFTLWSTLENGETVCFIHNTYKEEIDKLTAQNQQIFKNYEKIIDKKFWA